MTGETIVAMIEIVAMTDPLIVEMITTIEAEEEAVTVVAATTGIVATTEIAMTIATGVTTGSLMGGGRSRSEMTGNSPRRGGRRSLERRALTRLRSLKNPKPR